MESVLGQQCRVASMAENLSARESLRGGQCGYRAWTRAIEACN
jgi:hypothetical protein